MPPSHPRLSLRQETREGGRTHKKGDVKTRVNARHCKDEDFQVTKTTWEKTVPELRLSVTCFCTSGSWGTMPQRVLFTPAKRKTKAPKHIDPWEYF